MELIDRISIRDKLYDADAITMRGVAMLNQEPRVDAVPVVYGQWELAIGYDPNKKVQCQNCYKMAHEPTTFCPNCGANMDDTAPCEWCQHYKADPKMLVCRGNGQYTALTYNYCPNCGADLRKEQG